MLSKIFSCLDGAFYFLSFYKMDKSKKTTKKKEYWSKACNGAAFLEAQFREYKDTSGKKGINPEETGTNQINQIYHRHNQIFYNYSQQHFRKNFLNTASRFQLEQTKHRARKIG